MKKIQKKKGKIIPIIILAIITSITMLGVFSAITFQNIFPTTTPYITNESTVNLSYGIHADDGLSSITHSWNGTNTTLYDYTLIGAWNFNNDSDLGENHTMAVGYNPYFSNITYINGSGSNILWDNNGKFGGEFTFDGSDGHMVLKSVDTNLSQTALTLSFWFKANKLHNSRLIYGGSDSVIITLEASGTSKFSFKNTSNNQTGSMNGGTYETSWTNFVYTYNGTSVCSYKNGVSVLCVHNLTGPLKSGTTRIGSDWNGESYFFNGSLDEIMIWNKSLSSSEVLVLYNSVISKYNSSYFEYNTTINGVSDYHSPSFLCSTNSTGNEFCTAEQIIKDHADLKVNFSTNVRTIPNYFYGVNADYGYFNNQTSWIKMDKNLDGTLDTLVDKSWNKEVFLNSNLNLIRATIDLEGYYLNTTDDSGVNFSGSYNTLYNSLMKFANENDKIILLTIRDIPYWLRDNSSGVCFVKANCTASNYTKYANIINDMYNRITLNGVYMDNIYFEFYNEPSSNWNATTYITHFNETWKAVQIVNSSIKLIGPAVGLYYTNGKTTGSVHHNFLYEFARNISGASGISIHMYLNDYNNMQSHLEDFSLNCTRDFCSNLFITETNVFNRTVRNTTAYSSDFGKNIGTGLITGLNYPNLTSFDIYEWSHQYMENETVAGVENSWFMVTQPELINDNYLQFKPSYNVTKNFAHLCPAGATVYVSSNDDSSIKQVSCKKGNMYSLIVINTATTPKNITLNMSMENGTVIFPYASLMNYEDGSSIPVTGGIAQLGVMDSYEILYLSNDTTAPVLTITSPISPTGDVEALTLTVISDKALDVCAYTHNGGESTLLPSSGIKTNYTKRITSGIKFTNVFVVQCNDTYGNIGTVTTTVVKTGNEYSIYNEERSPFFQGFRFLESVGIVFILMLVGLLIFAMVKDERFDVHMVVANVAKILLYSVILGVFLTAIT